VKQFHLLRDAEGYSLGKADVVFKDREGANNALEYDGFWLFGRPLRIELAHTSCEPCARAMCQ
jgi:RNA recognition motif-containing protein